jgi:hypothetical protein
LFLFAAEFVQAVIIRRTRHTPRMRDIQ